MNSIVLLLLALVVTIFLGYKKWLNIIPAALTAAFLIGILNHLSVKQIIAGLPITTMFDIFILTYFFGFAIHNGTFSAVVNRAMFRLRRHGWLVMPALYLLSVILALVGPGIMAVAFIAPMAYQLAIRVKAPSILAYAAVVLGCIFGSNYSRSIGGTVIYHIVLENTSEIFAQQVSQIGFALTGAITTVTFAFLYVVCRGWKLQPADGLTSGSLNKCQRKTLFLALGILLLSMVPYLWKLVSGGDDLRYDELFSVPVTMTVGCCIASAMRLGDEKVILKENVPWQVVAMIGSLGMLIGVGKSIGADDALVNLLRGHISPCALAPLLAGIAGVMSMFASAVGVVIPTLASVLPVLSDAYGISPTPLFVAVFIAATLSGCAPLSTTGAMALAGCPEMKEREKLFYQVVFLPFAILGLTVISIVVFL